VKKYCFFKLTFSNIWAAFWGSMHKYLFLILLTSFLGASLGNVCAYVQNLFIICIMIKVDNSRTIFKDSLAFESSVVYWTAFLLFFWGLGMYNLHPLQKRFG